MLKNETDTLTALLRLEGAMTLLVAVAAYTHSGASWWMFGVLFLAPDISIAGYTAGRRVGAAVYNVMHWYGLPLAAIAAGIFSGSETMVDVSLVWVAHIAFDRMLGYGLKYADGFGVTHLSTLAQK